MEFTFSELKQKEVINLTDGRHLGKPCDISFMYPENIVQGIFVTGCKGFKFSRQQQFIPMKSVTKIGEDVILVKLASEKPDCPPQKPPKNDCNRNCPPQCPPNYPPDCCPPNRPPEFYGDRRSLDEYE